jgi:REP element-mobilizing transposase RayT
MLDAFIVMPNHIHGIIIRRGRARRAPTVERFGKPVAGSLPTLVGAYKSAVTRGINTLRKTHGEAVWQENYYEHIVRSEAELNRIREYIATNPMRWGSDRYNPERSAPADEDFEW